MGWFPCCKVDRLSFHRHGAHALQIRTFGNHDRGMQPPSPIAAPPFQPITAVPHMPQRHQLQGGRRRRSHLRLTTPHRRRRNAPLGRRSFDGSYGSYPNGCIAGTWVRLMSTQSSPRCVALHRCAHHTLIDRHLLAGRVLYHLAQWYTHWYVLCCSCACPIDEYPNRLSATRYDTRQQYSLLWFSFQLRSLSRNVCKVSLM